MTTKKTLLITIIALFVVVTMVLLIYSNLRMQYIISKIDNTNKASQNEAIGTIPKYIQINSSNQNDGKMNICNKLCAESPINISDLDNMDCNPKNMAKEVFAKFRDHLYCKGMIEGDVDYACNKKIYISQEEEKACEHGFYSLSAILFHKLEKKEEAKKYCLKIPRTSNGYLDNKLCDEFVNNTFEELLNNDFCSKFSEKNESLKCKAMVSGDKKYCNELTESNFMPDCIATANFIKSLNSKSTECEELFNPDINNHSDIACKLYFGNLNEEICKTKYDDFQKFFCAE